MQLFHKLILVDNDERIFINYLSTTAIGPDSIDKRVLYQHKSNIEKKLKEFDNNSKIREAYSWSANYHNYICENYKDFMLQPVDYNMLELLIESVPKLEPPKRLVD